MKNFVQEGDRVTPDRPVCPQRRRRRAGGRNLRRRAERRRERRLGRVRPEGTFDLTAASAATASMGALAYWDDTNKNVTATSSGNTKIGVFLVAKTNGQTTARIRLNGAF